MERITAKTNTYIRHVRKLMSSRSYRYEQRQFVADGVKLLREAVRWNARILAVLLQDGVEEPVPASVPRVIRVPEALMRDLSRMDTPQGVLTVCEMPPRRPLSPAAGALILDCIQDPGNLGTILRTADAMDVPVILTDDCTDPYSEKTVRATMGVPFRGNFCMASREEILDAFRAAGVPLCATALTESAADIRKVPLRDCGVIIGNEGNGVGEAFLAGSAYKAIIPISERCESLNAAVAAAVVMWELRRGV